MDRKEFLHRCGFACLGVLGVATIAESCAPAKTITAQMAGQRLSIPLASFMREVKGVQQSQRYVVVRNEKLNYPIVVYRQPDATYTALLLRCTHQSNELNVNGELLTCPAHGSEFNTRGEVVQGPASSKLRQFPTTTDAQNLYIDLA